MATLTPMTPTLSGGPNVTAGVPPLNPTTLTFTAAGASGDVVPVSSTMPTLVFIKNSAAGTPTVTFAGQADSWGGTAASHNLVVTTTSGSGTPSIAFAGVFLPYRWSSTIALTYSVNTNLSIAVVYVPYADL